MLSSLDNIVRLGNRRRIVLDWLYLSTLWSVVFASSFQPRLSRTVVFRSTCRICVVVFWLESDALSVLQ